MSSSLGAALLAVVQHRRDHYVEDIFPPDGESLDCKSAKWMRSMLDGIMREMRVVIEDREQPER